MPGRSEVPISWPVTLRSMVAPAIKQAALTIESENIFENKSLAGGEGGTGLRLQKKRESPISAWLCWAFWFPPRLHLRLHLWLHFARQLTLRQFRTATLCRNKPAMCRPDKGRERVHGRACRRRKLRLQGACDRRVRTSRAGDRGTGSMATDRARAPRCGLRASRPPPAKCSGR